MGLYWLYHGDRTSFDTPGPVRCDIYFANGGWMICNRNRQIETLTLTDESGGEAAVP